MLQESNAAGRDQTPDSAFSSRADRILARGGTASWKIETASRAELEQALGWIRGSMPVARQETVLAIYQRNPDVFRIVRNGGHVAEWSMLAYLPLNSRGTAAMVDGRFDGAAPDPAWICAPAERPEAVYIWLVFAPARMRQGLHLVQELVRIGGGCPVFSRAINETSARIQEMIGFVPAKTLFPDAPEWLLVLVTEVDTMRSAKMAMEVRLVRSIDELMRVFAVRSSVYMAEQFASYGEEFDGNDFCATHLLGTVNDDAAGCARIRFFGDFAKLERLAVRAEYRSTRLMWRLVEGCIDHCRRKGFRKLYAHCREDLVPAWKRFGARPIEGRPPFTFSDVRYREMEMDIEPTSDAIAFGAHPMVTLRPEGAWFELGPLDRSQFIPPPGRTDLIERHTKRLVVR
jgi:predicted GNAT family N-acyltransferase